MSSNDKRQRRTFTEEFKRDTVNLVVVFVEGCAFAAATKAVNVYNRSLSGTASTLLNLNLCLVVKTHRLQISKDQEFGRKTE